MSDTMRALVAGRGPDWVPAEVPIPRSGPGQVLIRNRAAATNNADLPMLAEADPTNGGHGSEFIAGFEYAGEIVGLGETAGDWQIGRRDYALVNAGLTVQLALPTRERMLVR